MEHKTAVDALAGLAQSSRLAIFRALVEAGAEGMQPSVLAQTLGIPANTLSFHLKGLMAAALISQERRGRTFIYRADFDRMNELLAFLTSSCCGGRACAVAPVEVMPVVLTRSRVS